MARIALIEPENASAEVKEIYDGKLKGKPGSIQKALAHRPAMLGNFLGFYASVGRSLDRRSTAATTASSTTSWVPSGRG